MPKILLIIILFLISASLIFSFKNPNSKLSVLGVLSPKTYSIAIYGDSMVDTMGEQLEYLQVALKKRYPGKTFYYYNYGIGSQNVEEGLNRFNQDFNYKTRHFVPLSSLHPDIIIIGSFSYNPFFPYDKDKHWNTLTKLVNTAKATGADVYMLSEIAPLKTGFGKGPNGANWQESALNEQSSRIAELLNNTIYLASDHLKVPLINVYAKTLVDGRFGNKYYVDSNDGIHPSVAGHQLTAETIASTIKLH
jgi:lysophospholipase L1-like esterase